MKNCVLCFIKHPKSNNAKSRLAKEIGAQKAGALYSLMIEDVLDVLQKVKAETIIFYYQKKYLPEFEKRFGADFKYIEQKGNNLGRKLNNAFKYVKEKYKKILVVGSDVPAISEKIINSAFKSLNSYDCVIGPSYDGGYYLIGFRDKKYTDKVFNRISWSTDKVFSQTRDILKNQKIKYAKVPKLTDIDNIESLRNFYRRVKNKKLKSVEYIKKNLNKLIQLKTIGGKNEQL